MTYISFIDMGDGETWTKSLAPIEPRFLQQIKAAGFDKIAAGESVEIIPGTGYTAHGVINGADWAVVTISDSGVPIATVGVCRRSRHSKMLLGKLKERSAVELFDCPLPAAPWCAIRPVVPAIEPDWMYEFIELFAQAVLNGSGELK